MSDFVKNPLQVILRGIFIKPAAWLKSHEKFCNFCMLRTLILSYYFQRRKTIFDINKNFFRHYSAMRPAMRGNTVTTAKTAD